MQSSLPAYKIAADVNQRLASNSTLIITAPPGAGKSTLLPLTMLEGIEDRGGKILLLEPRRIAARHIAQRMASMLGEKVGQTVGYRVRQDSKVSDATRIEVITEGILTRMLIDDPTMEDVSIIIFDEFHERNIHTDTALTLAREAQRIIRPDLRLVIMSATIDTDLISQHLQAPVVESEGRMFPIQTIYKPGATVTSVVRQALHDQEGDILVFLPGEADIRRTLQELIPNDEAARQLHASVLPLYAMLPTDQQQQAIAPSRPGERKVVLATSIAETSLTIEGVRVVIDSGLCRRMVFDARTGLSHLETVGISLDMADQRRGRAGRVAPGTCYRLWNQRQEAAMPATRTPEILEADLSPLLLDVAAWGESDPYQLTWLTPPPRTNVCRAQDLLRLLQALDGQHRITPHGRRLWQHPYHPRIAAMMVRAQDSRQARRLADLLDAAPSSWPPCLDEPGLGLLLSYAYPERIAQRQPAGIGRYRLASGGMATVGPDSPLCGFDWVVIASMNATGDGHVFMGAPLEEADLAEHIYQHDNVRWDSRQGQLLCQRERRIGTLVVDSRPLHEIDQEEKVRLICEAAKKDGLSMFDFNDEVQNLQRRIATLAQWHPELALPDLGSEAVLQQASQWLPLYIGRATTASELRRINLAEALWSLLSYDQQQQADRLAPTHIQVPTGSRIRLEYRQGAEQPVLRVRLQECFGMARTPTVDDGRQPILLELLSPGFKPVQLTQDLESFWSNTYFEVRKELRRRYPKHYWPDNPLEAEATRGVKGRK